MHGTCVRQELSIPFANDARIRRPLYLFAFKPTSFIILSTLLFNLDAHPFRHLPKGQKKTQKG